MFLQTSEVLPVVAPRTEGFRLNPLVAGLLLASGSSLLLPATVTAAESVTLPTMSVVGDKAASSGYVSKRSASATKTDTPLRDVPQSVSVVTRQQMNDQNVQNLADVVRYVPGVGMAQGEGNRETPVFRGNSTTSDFFIDGIRDDVQYFRDLYNIEQVEVLKGPNGMIFGRGGVGGVINRSSKEAGFEPVRQVTLQAGMHDNKRLAVDVGSPVNDELALRLNGMFEDSESYRDDVTLERYGINPTLTFLPGDNTKLVVSAEHFNDQRVADRGVASFQGKPLKTDPSTFFGDPALSPSDATVNAFNALVEHDFSPHITLRNRSRYAEYDKFYQNVYPGAVTADGTQVAIQAYNNATRRDNLFNQTDAIFRLETGGLQHEVLTGLELGRQVTDNLRNTGYFTAVSPTTTTVRVPVANPRTTQAIEFRQSATDANNHGTATVTALYLQDQITLTPQLQTVLGLRYDQFDVDFRNNRTGQSFKTEDGLVSPRVGLIFKPLEPLSLYTSYSLSYQPRAGEQLASLTLANRSLDPEEFTNYEVGAKWDINPQMAFTSAIYQLDRTNVAITDPADATRMLLVDGQRTRGVELALTGEIMDDWSAVGAYAYQEGEVLSDQSATIRKGATLANLPKNTFSLWNRYDFNPMWGAGLGIISRSSMLAATENRVTPASNVTLPGFTRLDAALFFNLNQQLQAQLNLENLLDRDYFATAHNNNNITPGSPRAVRVSLTAGF